MQASFELDRYEVISCSYKRNQVEGEYQGSLRFDPLIQKSEEDSKKYRVEIKATVSGLADIELVISLHLLIPFIRSFIHTISCQDGQPAVIIPVINVADLLTAPVLDLVDTDEDPVPGT